MPRLKNIVNDKERKTQCVLTSNTVVYKVLSVMRIIRLVIS